MRHFFKKHKTFEEMVEIKTKTITSITKQLRKVTVYRCTDEGCGKEEKFYTLPSDVDKFDMQEYSRGEVTE